MVGKKAIAAWIGRLAPAAVWGEIALALATVVGVSLAVVILRSPDPTVDAARERFERQYPPDPAWTFSGDVYTSHPDGWHQLCVTYQTGVSATAARAHYERLQGRIESAWRAGQPMLGKSSVRAENGVVTVCPF